MAKQLIQSLIVKFEPEKFENNYYIEIMKLIEEKANQNHIVQEPTVTGNNVLNLMAALEASISKINKSKKVSKKKPDKSA